MHNPNSGDVQYEMDAANQVKRSNGIDVDLTQDFDGAGESVHKKEIDTYYDDFSAQSSTQTSETYLVRSSVLGGAVISELTAQGQKQRTFVYMNGMVLGYQQQATTGAQYVYWEHRDASNASYRLTSNTGAVIAGNSGELDPLGTGMCMVQIKRLTCIRSAVVLGNTLSL